VSDTLAKLQSALAPKTGMRRIPFPLESYEHPSLPLSSKRLLNMMAEKQPDDARTAAALVSTPGLLPYLVVGSGPILAMNDDNPGRIYIVSGTRFYRMYFAPGGPAVVEDLGEIGTPDTTLGASNAFVTIAAGPTAAVVCVTPNAFTCAHEPGAPLNQITDPDFPGASSVAYVDGYFAFSNNNNTSSWFISRLLDPLAFDALDFVFSDALPNVIRRVISHRGQLWTIGEGGFEIWYNAGAADFPFRRAAGGVIPIGTAAPLSVCRADKSVWWLGIDGIVYRSEGYEMRRVSTHAIEAIIAGNVVGLDAMTHPYRGHWVYSLTTTSNRSMVYDAATGVWHERSTSADGVGPWQASTAATGTNTIQMYGDRDTGQIYTLGMQATDAGVAVLRQATFPPLWAETRRAFCARVEVEMECGGAATPGALTLEWSDDGSRTWGPTRIMSSGAPAETRHRVFTTRLGSFRQRTFRLSSHGLTRLYALDADIQAGGH